jgi:hypothetical protein
MGYLYLPLPIEDVAAASAVRDALGDLKSFLDENPFQVVGPPEWAPVDDPDRPEAGPMLRIPAVPFDNDPPETFS